MTTPQTTISDPEPPDRVRTLRRLHGGGHGRKGGVGRKLREAVRERDREA